MPRAPELEFLDQLLTVRQDKLHYADWLKSPFPQNKWTCIFGRVGTFDLNFNLKLPSGRSLTQRPRLLRLFKYWLTACTHDTVGAGYSLGYQYGLVSATTAWIDHLLLNAAEYDLEEREIRSITPDIFRGIFNAITSDRLRQESVYNWSARLEAFIRQGLRSTAISDLEKVLKEIPELGVVDDEICDSSRLKFAASEVPFARSWLYLNNLYDRDGLLGYRYALNSRAVAALLLGNTLRGVDGTKIKPPILNASPYFTASREYPMVPSSTRGDARRMGSYSRHFYQLAARTLPRLSAEKDVRDSLPAQAVLDVIDTLDVDPQKGRFLTLPANVVFDSVRKAIEFHITYGSALIASYVSLLHAGKCRDKQINELPTDVFLSELDPLIRALGVDRWAIPRRKRKQDGTYLANPTSSDRFAQVRMNKGLHDLLDVYFGMVQAVVGTLMARRQGELGDLLAGSALDQSRRYLIFDIEKSSSHLKGYRKREARPIASIAAEMIGELERIQIALIDCGYLDKHVELFSPVSEINPSKLISLRHNVYNCMLDAFCDYIETPLLDGKRYYIRQHMLRRFFAMLFFWTHSFGGLETLRWFLGHSDVEHIYRYISESTPGAVLRGVKAGYAAKNVSSYENLEALLKERYGAKEFTLLDEDELESHIEDLMSEGLVEVEPQFFNGPEGKDYKVVVIVRGIAT